MNITNRPVIKHRIEKQAAKDADQQHYDPDSPIGREIGMEPQLDPANNLEVVVINEVIESRYAEELTTELRRNEDQLTGHHPAAVLLLLLVILFLAEYASASLLFRDFGLEGSDRTIMALMLASIMFVITWIAAKYIPKISEQEGA